jgi:hypothetical protein
MVEQVVNDGLGNVITLKYDDSTDSILVKNSNIHDDFRKIYLNDSPEIVENVITIEDRNGPDEWNNYTDDFGRWELQLFWDTHKQNKVTKGLR